MRQEIYAVRKYALDFARKCLFSVVILGEGERGNCGSAWVENDIEGEETRHENKCVWKMPEGTQLKERKIEV